MSTTVALVELSPETLREVRFTERFRGYDAAEVDAFLREAAEALDELVAERSEPLAALAAERARTAIDQVRQDTLAEIAELQSRRDGLAEAIRDLQRTLAERRRGLLEALELLDAGDDLAGDDLAGDSTDGAAPAAPPAGEGTDEGSGEGSADRPEEGSGAGADDGSEAPSDDGPASQGPGAPDSFLVRLERAAAESGGAPR